MDVEGLRRPEPVRVPDRLHDLLARHQRAGLLGEEREQVVLLGCEGDLLAVQAYAGGLAVDGQVLAVLIGACRRRRVVAWLCAPHHRSYPRDDLTYPEGFGDVVVRAELEPDHAVRLVAAGADHDDRDVAARPQRLADVEAVGVGQPEVEEDDVVGALVRQGRPARGHPLDLEAVAQQAAPERFGDRFVVFHQEYAHVGTLVLES